MDGPGSGPRRGARLLPGRRSVAFLRIPAAKPSLFAPEREGEPWSIRVADAATGKGREVFRADKGAGSVFRDGVADNQVLWAGDRLVFPWEKTGWLHLYSVPAAGGAATALTQGAFEVEYVTEGPYGTTVVYNSNEGDIDRRHIWAVPVAGGTPVRLTTSPGIQWAPVITSDGALACLRSSADAAGAAHPEDRRRRRLARSRRRSHPRRLPREGPRRARGGDGHRERRHADSCPALQAPRARSPASGAPPSPYFHGGSRRQMLLGFHYMDYYNFCYAMNQYLASRGYVVLAVNYRSGIGYGMEFREALRYGAAGASEFADVLGAGRYLKARARRRSRGDRPLGRILRRLPDRPRPGSGFRPLRRGRRRARRPRLERDDQELPARLRCAGRPRLRQAGLRVVAPGQRQDLALARAPHPRRRRPQRALQRDRHPRGRRCDSRA